MNRSAEKLILLVGSNPLPNYLAAQLLKPKSLSFIYSPETEQVKNYLKKVLEYMVSDIEEKGIADATDPKCVRGRVQECLGEGSRVHLHYSGGTKVMATHARMQFREAGYDDRHASYLDERRGVLRFDDGYEISLADHNLRLTMDDIVGLHGIERKDRGDSVEQAPTAEDAEKIAKNVFACTELARKLYDIHRENGKRVGLEKAKENPIPLSRFIPKDDEFSIFWTAYYSDRFHSGSGSAGSRRKNVYPHGDDIWICCSGCGGSMFNLYTYDGLTVSPASENR